MSRLEAVEEAVQAVDTEELALTSAPDHDNK